jgi:predicted methyltransferase
MKPLIVLADVHLEAARDAYRAGKASASISPDLGLTTVEVALDAAGIRLPSGRVLAWSEVEAIAREAERCFVVEEQGLHKAQLFSETTNRVCSLMATRTAPTMLLSGIPMHRIKGTDPYQDTLSKIRTVKPVVGRVLDTATGLGYTAIEAAKTAEEVVTIELDPAVLELARLNPWSRPLFNQPSIVQMVGDSFDLVQELGEGSFSRVIHDPPAFGLAGDLYSGAFYRELYWVLGRGGRLFHYIGDPDSKSGRNVARGATQRLQAAGFRRIRPRPEAFGLLAYK